MSAAKIEEGDEFNELKYPKVVDELNVILDGVFNIPLYFKENILISFFKNHSLQKDWIVANEELAAVIISGLFPSGHIETLFQSGFGNKMFLQSFEAYIKRQVYQSILANQTIYPTRQDRF
jgi:hypothetical protein